jgi:two-component system chemotaxis response regulator CheB
VKVLVVDDAVVVRRLVADCLATDPRVEVQTAANGQLALDKLDLVKPDVVTLDIEMPVLDGLATLKELRKRRPDLPVIMFSTLTEAGGRATLEALSLGASDYLTKPSNTGSWEKARSIVIEQMLPKVLGLAARRQVAAPAVAASAAVARRAPRARQAPVRAVVIGVSTGGPAALAQVVPLLPASLPVPVLIVQHMPPLFTRLLAERLDATSPLQVVEASDGEVLRAGKVVLAPGDHHLVVAQTTAGAMAKLNQDAPENFCRPAVDPLFRSAATTWRDGVLAVVLTGMGHDGLQGARAVQDAGGSVLAQDAATSVVWGMPGAVASAGLADEVLPLDKIADAIVRRTTAGALVGGATR